MKSLNKPARPVSVRKAINYAIVINALQIALILVMLAAIIIVPEISTSYRLLLTLTITASLVIIWGAVVDIREALHTRRLMTQLDDMDDTIDAMSQFNNTLRAQRHDFLNHLQVVYSLIEMEEYQEANDYIEQVYGKITAVSRVMKTANPAVNALLQVKVAACEKAGVHTEVSITSRWEALENTMPDWEMCKVLSNLIDNAIDAMETVPEGRGDSPSRWGRTSSSTPSGWKTQAKRSRRASVTGCSSPVSPPKATAMAWGCTSFAGRSMIGAAILPSAAMKTVRYSAALYPSRMQKEADL